MSPRSLAGPTWMALTALAANALGQAAPQPLLPGVPRNRIRVIEKPAVSKPPPDESILRWRNGETIKGELAAATASEVSWASPLFEDPLVLAWPAVRRIDRTSAPVSIADPFAVILRDGSHLYGDLAAVTDQAISMRSTRHGPVLLKRSEVRSVRLLHGGNLVTAGPTGDAGWQLFGGAKNSSNPSPTPTLPLLKTGPAGALLLPYWNRGAALDLKLPERVDLEFRVRSSARPDFQLSLVGGAKQRLRIEMWDDELVLAAGDQFKTVRKVADTEREVALRLCWDRKAQTCSVFTPTGEPITEWAVPDDPRGGEGQLVLQNKGRDLALEFLRVRDWDGQPPPRIAGNLPRVECADGRVIEGEIGGGEEGSIRVRSRGAETDTRIPITEVDALVFSADPVPPGEPQSSLTFADGSWLRGQILSIKGDEALLATTFTTEPLAARMRDLRQLLLEIPPAAGAAPEPALDTLDTVAFQGAKPQPADPTAPTLFQRFFGQGGTTQGSTLHGHLAASGEAQPRWLPVGGKVAARLAPAVAADFIRAIPANAKVETSAALFFTTGGDVLPGRLRGIDASGVEIEEGIFASPRLAAENLDAIVFGGTTSSGGNGFGDSDWRILHGNATSVRKTAETVQMQPDTAIGHASILQSSEVQFTITTEGFGGARLRLFSAGEDNADALSLVLANLGGRLYYGLETTEGQGNDLQQTSLSSDGVIQVALAIDEKRVELSVNGLKLRSFPIPAAKRKGSGLVIKPANVFGNEERPITLSALSSKIAPGRIWVPEVAPEARTEALTVPRFRHDDPPRHVLLAANGDVLRGEIEAATASHFGFRAGLENLRVPRERVKAAIWLKRPEAEAPKTAPENPAAKILEQKSTRRIRYTSAGLSTLISVLQREVPGLKFKTPTPEDSRRVSMQFGELTLGEELEEIGRLFDLRYRLEDDGTIVFEKGLAPAQDLLEKVYWLKPTAFPGGAVKDLLAMKGVLFPAKATALWQPSAGQLTVTNTAANHQKLAAVLAADFEGSLGSPTHWLQLTSGARFGLAVEKFEADAIVGRHALYGQCRVPMAQVHTIRTSPPEANPALKALQNWRLTFAPEPVLPETGGESSPTIGKAAKPFKLPLLAGGDFDLAQEKGQVVVLDFWATWCGPCIKSLPGLIEALAAFPPDRVKLIGVNQSEPANVVKSFLETRGWKLRVAMDAGQGVARQYGVEGIPHTVIVGPDGKVAWVKTGYSPDGATEAANAVKQLLTTPR